MSYPRQIRTLIIEDEETPIANYRALYEELKSQFDVAPPILARSFDDAVVHLSNGGMFHLVILDLGLPRKTHEPAEEKIEPGIDLVARCATREQYPVPCILVISGRLGRANLATLRESLGRDFWHGEMVNKGLDETEAIEKALGKVLQYSSIGIHIHDGGDKLYPTVSPREDDLLRRAILAEPYCIGVDLEWWGAYHAPSMALSAVTGKTKVLWGRFLLSDNHEASRPAFFKFEPRETADFSHGDVALMVQKLSHIKRCSAMKGHTRSLIVTQQVGESSARPLSLAEMLARPTSEVSTCLSTIVSEITVQLKSLGSITEDRLPPAKILWSWHDDVNLASAYAKYGDSHASTPLNLLKRLRAETNLVWIKRQSSNHGDLNATNIALEVSGSGLHAFIIDAAGMRADAAGKDLAMLEVTTLLHQGAVSTVDLIQQCSGLYAVQCDVPEQLANADQTTDIARNTFSFIREIRKQAVSLNVFPVYALLVFDCAMMQLGGLGIQGRGNKISNPQAAVLLAKLSAEWLIAAEPEFLTEAVV